LQSSERTGLIASIKRASVWSHEPSTDQTATLPQSHDAKVAAALEEYFELLEDGHGPDRAGFLERHPLIADSLAECLDGLEFVTRVAGDFSPGPTGPSPASTSSPAPVLGDFRLIREIGRGGMGIVYEAEQVSLGRRVALKVLHAAAALDARQCQRFQVEAQAVALLHHDHIVPVFGGGSDQGAHYLAMQLVDGPSLAQVIQDLKAQASPKVKIGVPREEEVETAASGSGNLAPLKSSSHSSAVRARCREAARLGLQAALALEHAHQLGVIHRDVKPSNLLVDRQGKLWVVDFGLARLPQTDQDLTRTGDVLGTLRYMSPEQVRAERGAVDCSTDIYSLGVTLYELTTLQPAFDAQGRQELLRSILEVDPMPPRRIETSIPRDLETIILKAMQKEPSARYASACELADDFRHFLADEPVQARLPSLLERSFKWARRHRTAVVTSITALIVTLAITSFVLWQAKRRTDATLVDFKQAILQHRLGVERGLAAIDQMIRPLVARCGLGQRADAETERILSWAIFYDDNVPTLFAKVDMAKEAVAKANRQAGFCRMALRNEKGKTNYHQALSLYNQLIREHPDQIYLFTGLMETLLEYSDFLAVRGDRSEADALFRQGLEAAETVIQNKDAGKHCFTMALAPAVSELAWRLVRVPGADPGDLSLAIRLATQTTAWEPDQAVGWRALGVAHYRQGDVSAAAPLLTKAMELDDGKEPLDLFFLAAMDRLQGNCDEASRRFDAAVRLMSGIHDRDADLRAERVRVRDEIAHILSR
jgi:serine/threonine protein kinase